MRRRNPVRPADFTLIQRRSRANLRRRQMGHPKGIRMNHGRENTPPDDGRPSRPRFVRMLLWMVAVLLLAGVVWLALVLSGAADATRALLIVAWVMVILNFGVRLWTRRNKRRR